MGINGCSIPATRRYARLASALPGTRAGPFSPPFKRPSRVRRSRPDIWSVSPWHCKHFR